MMRTTEGPIFKEPQRPAPQEEGTVDSGTQPQTGRCLPQTPMPMGLHGTAALTSGPAIRTLDVVTRAGRPAASTRDTINLTSPELGLESAWGEPLPRTTVQPVWAESHQAAGQPGLGLGSRRARGWSLFIPKHGLHTAASPGQEM